MTVTKQDHYILVHMHIIVHAFIYIFIIAHTRIHYIYTTTTLSCSTLIPPPITPMGNMRFEYCGM